MNCSGLQRLLCELSVLRLLTPALCAGVSTLGSDALAQTSSPFATRVIEYDPAPGQFVQNPLFNDPTRALGPPPSGDPVGGLAQADNSKCVTLGGFGGSITLGFDRPIWRNPRNPFGMDFIVFGNAFYVAGNPASRYAECGVIEVSKDANANGQADDPWYLIPGSHIVPPTTRTSLTYSPASLNPTWIPAGRSGGGNWTVQAFALIGPPFAARPPLVNVDPLAEQVWGYADLMPTLKLGDTGASDTITDPLITPERFYTRPDAPLAPGVTPGSGGGSAIAINWAVDPSTGAPALLDRIDFVRITSSVAFIDSLLGETSTEVSSVADVGPLSSPDWNRDGLVSVQDIFDFLNSWFANVGEGGGGDFNDSGATTVQDIFDFLSAWFAG